MKPGDRIKWTYEQDGSVVTENETLWSMPMKRWVPIGSALIHTLVSIDDEQISWMNKEGCFHARVDDTDPLRVWLWKGKVLPRACG